MVDREDDGVAIRRVYVPDLEASERMGVREFFRAHPEFDVRYGASLAAEGSEVAAEIGDAQVVCAALGRVSEEAIARATDLRLIVKTGIGVDNIAVEAARERSIPVLRMGQVNSDGPAEWVIGAALALFRRFAEMSAGMREGRWQELRGDWAGRVPALNGRTLGIAGLGSIGRRLASLGLAHGMTVIACDPYATAIEGVRLVDKPTLLREADVLSLNMILTDETHHWLSTAELALMKPTAIVCNASRGPILDEAALAAALLSGALAAAAVDVYESEPPAADNPLFSLENVLLTPHLGGCTDYGYREIGELTVELVRRFAYGEAIPSYCVVVQTPELHVAD
jgi:D-3-phosphoglycerate dehydrogenase / 2-oxoglutarate reductase